MKQIISQLLAILFPQEKRSSRVKNTTLADVTAMVSPTVRMAEEISIHALLPYKDPLTQDLIWALKYEDNAQAATLLGKCIADFLVETLSEELPFVEKIPLIIPLPLSEERKKARGYNQVARVAQIIAGELSENIQYKESGLIRVKNTVPQTSLTRNERMENVRGAFAGKKDTVEGRLCILLDDVTTTGSTLKEAARALTRAGAQSVLCIACAYA